MIQLATFQSDVTPPLGHPLCAGWYPPAKGILDPLAALGLILAPDDQSPMVLCTLDWAELSNGDYDRWREEIAVAVGTEADRVAVHCTHAHDTPWPDRDAQDILDAHGHPDVIMAGDWAERVRAQAAQAAGEAIARLQPCTHLSVGQARVDRIASNRRVMGPDGKVAAVRWTKTPDPEVRAAPEGVIDPMLKTIGFYQGDTALALLHYYAVHPTSRDGTGLVTPEFVGLARNRRTEESGVPHIYFTGCGGNVTAGKYNDGVADNRELFTGRIRTAMVEAGARQYAAAVGARSLDGRAGSAAAEGGSGRGRPAGGNSVVGPRGQRTQQSRPHGDVSATLRAAHSRHLHPSQRPGGGGEFTGRDLYRIPAPRACEPPGRLCRRGGIRRFGHRLHHYGDILCRGWLRAGGRLRVRAVGKNRSRRHR